MYQWKNKEDQAFLTIHRLKQIGENYVKEIKKLRDIGVAAINLKLSVKQKSQNLKKKKKKKKKKARKSSIF